MKSPAMKKPIKKSAFSAVLILVLSSAFWFSFFEVSARFWIRSFGDPLDRARLVMEPNERYLWRMRPDFSGTFESSKLVTDENGFRVPDGMGSDGVGAKELATEEFDWLVLGPSSAFGWGVDLDDTYSAIAAKAAGKTILNASQVGYGISQGLRVYEDHRPRWKLTPKTVFIAYGVNDVDRFRFFGPMGISDREVFALQESLEQLRLEKWIYRFAFPGLLMRAMQEGAVKFGCPGKSKLEIRESEDGFFASLSNLVEQVLADGHRPVVIDSPFRYPFVTDPNLAELATQQFAAAHWAANSGNCDEAKRLFQKARANEPHRVAYAISQINTRLRLFVAKKNIRLVEASKMVSAADDFVDPVHFSVKGNKQIAEGVLRELNR
jgi:hypothetical protein